MPYKLIEGTVTLSTMEPIRHAGHFADIIKCILLKIIIYFDSIFSVYFILFITPKSTLVQVMDCMAPVRRQAIMRIDDDSFQCFIIPVPSLWEQLEMRWALCNNVIWALRRRKSPATRPFVKQIIQVDNKKNIKALHYGLFVGGIHHLSVGSPHKRQ